MHKFVKNNQIVIAKVPADWNANISDEDYVSMKGYNRCTIIISTGVTGAAATIIMKQATDVAGTGEKALAFTEYFTKAGVTPGDFTKTAASSTFATTTDANSLYIIEIEAIDLDQENKFDCIRFDTTDPGTSTFGSALYILSDPRHAEETMPSAITD